VIFTFILVSLSYWKHQDMKKVRTAACCDLLSF